MGYSKYAAGGDVEDFPIDQTYRVDALYRLALSSYYAEKYQEALNYCKKALEFDSEAIDVVNLIERIKRTVGEDSDLEFPDYSSHLIKLSDDEAIKSSGSTIVNIEQKLRELQEEMETFRNEGIVVTRLENALSDKTMSVDDIFKEFSDFCDDVEEIRIIRDSMNKYILNKTMRAMVMKLRIKVMDPANLDQVRKEYEKLQEMAEEREKGVKTPDLEKMIKDKVCKVEDPDEEQTTESKIVGLMCLGRLAYNKRRYQEAMDYFEKILDLDGEHKVAQKYHLECRIKQSNLDRMKG